MQADCLDAADLDAAHEGTPFLQTTTVTNLRLENRRSDYLRMHVLLLAFRRFLKPRIDLQSAASLTT